MRDKRIKIILSFVAILCAGTIIITGMSGENGQKEIADVQNPVVQKKSEKNKKTAELKRIELRNYKNTLKKDTSEGLFTPGTLVEHGESLYCSLSIDAHSSQIQTVDLDGRNKRMITDRIEAVGKSLMVTDQYIYICDIGYSVKQYTLDGELAGEIGEILNWGAICHWYFYDGYLYFQGMYSDEEIYDGLYRATADSEYPECVTDNCNSNDDTEVYFYEDKIYFYDRDLSFCCIGTDGSEETVLMKNNVEPVNRSTMIGAETGCMIGGIYLEDNLYYVNDNEKVFYKRNIQTMEEEKLSWDYTQVERLCMPVGKDYISGDGKKDGIGYLKSHQISTGEEIDLQLHNENVASEKAKEAQCQLIYVPGASRVYYIANEDGEKSVCSVKADGGETIKLDNLRELAQSF